MEINGQTRSEVFFGVDARRREGRRFVVLDKSFLQAVTLDELKFYLRNGWIS